MHKKNSKDSALEKHEFAFFCRDLPVSLTVSSSYVITDRDLVHRMIHIVHIETGETIVLFRDLTVATARVDKLSKNGIDCTIISVKNSKPLEPVINWYLPLLDREAFEASVYILTSMGAASITPTVTEKSDKKLTRQIDRLERIMVAAAEQSKQFVLPVILPVKPFAELDMSGYKLFFDPEGTPAFDVLQSIRTQKSSVVSCLIGPEGDLTQAEKDLLTQREVIFCALTPTILRAEQAVTVAMGLLRSCGKMAA